MDDRDPQDHDSLEQLQRDLDAYLDFYNTQRAHQGYRTKGRTPLQAFIDALNNTIGKEVDPEAA